MSSCGIYSLFPIFTKETLYYPNEIIGKWKSKDDSSNLLDFSRIALEISVKSDDGRVEKDKERFSISLESDDEKIEEYEDIFVFNDIDTVYKDSLNANFEKLSSTVKKISEGVNDFLGKDESEFYFLQMISENSEIESYKAYVVKIGEDLFLDLFPLKEQVDNPNFIPVHTFMKIDVSKDKLELKTFNEKKLKNLFKSNLIRLSHEIVDDRVLITAQPRQIQKFIERYAQDESVYEETLVYHKIKGHK